MLVVFQAIFSWAGPLMNTIDGAFGSLGEWVGGRMADGAFKDMLVYGLIKGVGGVLTIRMM